MNKGIALFALALLSGVAHAEVKVEFGVGMARAEAKEDGNWYQKRFPHELDLNSQAITLGIRTDVSEHIALHAGAYRFGQNRSNALAVTHDALYAPRSATGCPDECPPLANFQGHGFTWGLRAMAEFHTTGPVQVGFMAGPIVYRTTWTENVPDWFPTEPTAQGYTSGPVIPLHLRHTRWNVSGAAGVRITHKNMFAELMWYRDGSSVSNETFFPPIWKSHTALTYGVSF